MESLPRAAAVPPCRPRAGAPCMGRHRSLPRLGQPRPPGRHRRLGQRHRGQPAHRQPAAARASTRGACSSSTPAARTRRRATSTAPTSSACATCSTACREGVKLLLYAFERAHDERGAPDWEHSTFYVPDAYARDVARSHPERFEWVASIHPYRPDALDALAWAKKEGARGVKWLPSGHGNRSGLAALRRFLFVPAEEPDAADRARRPRARGARPRDARLRQPAAPAAAARGRRARGGGALRLDGAGPRPRPGRERAVRRQLLAFRPGCSRSTRRTATATSRR